jgi:hypothetical protein
MRLSNNHAHAFVQLGTSGKVPPTGSLAANFLAYVEGKYRLDEVSRRDTATVNVATLQSNGGATKESHRARAIPSSEPKLQSAEVETRTGEHRNAQESARENRRHVESATKSILADDFQSSSLKLSTQDNLPRISERIVRVDGEPRSTIRPFRTAFLTNRIILGGSCVFFVMIAIAIWFVVFQSQSSFFGVQVSGWTYDRRGNLICTNDKTNCALDTRKDFRTP